MDVDILKYLIQIENIGSINQAAKSLYVSQASLSRILANAEESLGFVIFRRGNRGITATHEGKQFLREAREIVGMVEEFNNKYFQHERKAEAELLVAAQRCSVIVKAFVQYYNAKCLTLNSVNLAIMEEPCGDILHHVASGVYNIGVLHVADKQDEYLRKSCQNLMLNAELLDKSHVCAQVRADHPLALRPFVSREMLADYAHITFADEDITEINYCSDIQQYNQNTVNKRIVIQDRGSLLEIIQNTDAYYLGCDWSNLRSSLTKDIRYVPLHDTDIIIKTYCVKRNGYTYSYDEQAFLGKLKALFLDIRN